MVQQHSASRITYRGGSPLSINPVRCTGGRPRSGRLTYHRLSSVALRHNGFRRNELPVLRLFLLSQPIFAFLTFSAPCPSAVGTSPRRSSFVVNSGPSIWEDR